MSDTPEDDEVPENPEEHDEAGLEEEEAAAE